MKPTTDSQMISSATIVNFTIQPERELTRFARRIRNCAKSVVIWDNCCIRFRQARIPARSPVDLSFEFSQTENLDGLVINGLTSR